MKNPLLNPQWETPFGVPPFDQIFPAHFAEAFDFAFAEHEKEIEDICSQTATPDFKNTLESLERAGRLLDRVGAVFFNLTSAHTSTELQDLERVIAPRFARHQSKIWTHPILFERIEKVLLDSRVHSESFDFEQKRLLDRIHKGFVRAGARLDESSRKRMGEVLERLALLGTQFAQNILKDESAYECVLDSEDSLKGLPATWRESAAAEASRRGKPGKWVITLTRSSVEACLALAEDRALRETLFQAFSLRGEGSGDGQNPAIIREILTLRLERARLLGFSTFADFKLEDTMARSPDAVRALLQEVWNRAAPQAERDRDELEVLARSDGFSGEFSAWDWRYYSEKLRRERHSMEDGELKAYFQLDRMIEAAFFVADQLFGVRFVERRDLPVYHPDVRTWEVIDREGAHVGVFYGDYFSRPSKRSGAWMSKFQAQNLLRGNEKPIILNVLNCTKGVDGKPTLLGLDDVRTLFHELGHGLHGLLSRVTYPTLAGTAVVRDFVELPSQLFEHWVERSEVLSKFALHWKTGQAMPSLLIEKMKSARRFGQALATVEYVSSAFVDLEAHLLTTLDGFEVGRFETEILSRIGMPRATIMRHRPAHFAHAFSGDGYSAGYYSYLWAEVLDADAFAAFEEAGDVFDASTATKLKQFIYSSGNTRPAEEAYLQFRGKMPTVEPLLKKRGLIP